MRNDPFSEMIKNLNVKPESYPVMYRQIKITWCNNICPKCKSSMRRKWLLFGKAKCIHPKCGYME